MTVQTLDVAQEARLSRASQIDAEVRSIELESKRNFVRLGQAIAEVEAGELWRDLGWQSMDAWLCDAAPVSRASGYEALRAIKRLKEADISPEEALGIPRSNLNLLTSKLPKSKRRDFLIPAAELGEREFRQHIQSQAPELHVEDVVLVRLRFEGSAYQVLTDAWDAHQSLQDGAGATREAAVEEWATGWLQAPYTGNLEHYHGLTNQEVWERVQDLDVK